MNCVLWFNSFAYYQHIDIKTVEEQKSAQLVDYQPTGPKCANLIPGHEPGEIFP